VGRACGCPSRQQWVWFSVPLFVPCRGSWGCDGILFPVLLIFDKESVIISLWLDLILSPKPRVSLTIFPCYFSIRMDACELKDNCSPDLVEMALCSSHPHVSV